MANIEFFTGFEGCGTTADCRTFIKFTTHYGGTLHSYSSTNGYDNGKCLRGPTSDWPQRKSIGWEVTPGKTKVVGWHVRGMGTEAFTTNGGGTLLRLVLSDSSYLYLQNESDGLAAYRASTEIASCETVVTTSLTHIEVKVFSDATSGTFQVKVDGALVLDGSSLDTNGSDIQEIQIGSVVTGPYFDNIFVADDWVGELKSVLLQPTSDDAVQFTPSAGADNYAMVDDTAQDGDTTYVESGTNGHKDRYGFSDLDVGLDPKVLTVVGVARKTDVGAVSLKLQSRQDTTDYDLDTFTLTSSYPAAVTDGQIVTLDTCPDGTTALSRNEVNDLKFGFEAVI